MADAPEFDVDVGRRFDIAVGKMAEVELYPWLEGPCLGRSAGTSFCSGVEMSMKRRAMSYSVPCAFACLHATPA
jgi:hypothetical protein